MPYQRFRAQDHIEIAVDRGELESQGLAEQLGRQQQNPRGRGSCQGAALRNPRQGNEIALKAPVVDVRSAARCRTQSDNRYNVQFVLKDHREGPHQYPQLFPCRGR